MSQIKSYSVGDGDMFHIDHGSDNFTIIDCCLNDENRAAILNEVARRSAAKGITRFISTHPDDDHIAGLEFLDARIQIVNFYCVKNAATKPDQTDSFDRYCELRDSDKKAFYIEKGCSRRWMNRSDDKRGSAGINILWPDPNNEDFKAALKAAAEGQSPNNISPIFTYSMDEGVRAMWMGDLETDFMEKIADHLDLPPVHILFAPHHGRDTGKVPESLLSVLSPKIIVIGEADCEDLNYYKGYNTICQNTAGDIVFECEGDKVHVFTSNEYEAEYLADEGMSMTGYHYVGTLDLKEHAEV